MSWRTVVISSRCKLDYKMGYMVVRGEDTTQKRVLLDEIAILMLENPAISLTGCLLEELIKCKIRVIFCDSTRSPVAELQPYYGSHDVSRKIKTQAAWMDDIKGEVWADIISDKIRKQAAFLQELGSNEASGLLKSYIGQIEYYDASNREGHAAKVYFNALFGKQFTRSEATPINAALNYGYSIILSAFNREVVAGGYLTQLGLFHDNIYNPYNLSCDLMEPFRVLADRAVYSLMPAELTSEIKHSLWDILNQYVRIDGSSQTVLNAIKIYARSVFNAINDRDTSKLLFYEND